MRRNLLLAIVVGAALALGAVTVAGAASTTVRAGNLVLRFGGNVSPKKLPRGNFAPIALNVFANVSTPDRSHPSALREAVVDLDRNGRIDTRGAPVCRTGQLEARNTAAARRACGAAIVGQGTTQVQIAFVEQAPITVRSPLLIFNGGTGGGKTTMLIHAFITVPVPAPIVTRLTITKINRGRFGLRTVARVPVIAGGSGSVLNFKFTIARQFFRAGGQRHPYLSARCRDGRFQAKIVSAKFKNEARTPGTPPTTVLKGNVLVPCQPRR